MNVKGYVLCINGLVHDSEIIFVITSYASKNKFEIVDPEPESLVLIQEF